MRPLLFFSGIGANIELLAPFLDRLVGRDIITFDMPGVGGSPNSRMPYRPSTMAKAADRILSDMGYGQVDVMGVSWGGMIAQQFAFKYRRRVDHLVLAATSPGALMVPGRLSALVKMVNPRRYADPQFMRTHFDTLYGGTMQDPESYLSRIHAPTRLGYFYQVLAILGWTSVGILPFVSAKTLIVVGSDDRLVRPANGRILKFLIRNSRLEIVEGGGHLFLLTHLDQVAKVIDGFLDGSRRQGGERSSITRICRV